MSGTGATREATPAYLQEVCSVFLSMESLMPPIARIRHRLWQTAAAVIVAALLAGNTAAQERTEGRRTTARPASAKAFENLGPGPLPPRPTAGERIHRPKAATLEDAIDQCVEFDMWRLSAPGAAVAVVLDGELIYERGYGVKNRDGDDPVDPDTIFRIGSVTKQMTAAAVMQQVELGRVELDAPVTDYIPEFVVGGRWPADRIKVWHTLTHTTGFPDRVNEWGSADGNEGLSIWAQGQREMELHAPPGSFWNYSNPNFMIAGLVAERASGTPYRDLLKNNLWEPAGMHSTTFDPTEVMASGNYSDGHHYDPTTYTWYVLSPDGFESWAGGPAGFAFSTVGDLVRWALLLTDGGEPVLSSRSAAAMQHPHQWTHYTPDRFYGFGITIEEYEGLDIRQHGGSITGYGTYVLWVPERRFAVALLTNVTWALSDAPYCIVDEVLQPAPVEPPDLSTDPSTWRKYVGDYVITDEEGTTTEAEIFLAGDWLMGWFVDPAAPGTHFSTRLNHQYLDTFHYDSNGDRQVDTEVTFCGTRGNPGYVKWMRNRRAVGERQNKQRAAGRAISP
jgi:CubicO group peptidase (beta-lactamase class C family)